MKHTEAALHRPVTTIVVFVALALMGLIASRLLPLEQFPDIEFPGIFVQIPYDGSTPEEVERLITRPMEEALATLSGVERMFSTSSDNQAQVFMRFGWDENMGAKGIEARAKIDAIRHQLPDDVRRVFVFTGSLGDQPVLQLRIASERDLSGSYDMLDRVLKRRIERIEGVSRVELQGVEPREIRILLKPDMLAAYGVDIAEIRDLLMRSNFSVSAGRITAGGQRFSVRPSGEFSSVEEVRNLAVNERGLRLRDVAEVDLRSPDRNYGRHLDREYAIGLVVNKTTGSNLVEVTDRVIAEVEKIGDLPQMRGINIFPLDNQGDSVRSSLGDLLRAGLYGGLLAVIVLYLFLRHVTTTLIVIASIPFSLLITLGALYFAGLSLNILTMMGLMLAVGMLVDNAVVVTESIFRHRADDKEHPYTSTIRGVREVGLAVVAGTMTTIIVFAPIVFGAKVDITIFLTHVAITIFVALGASLVIAQTLVPMLAARIAAPPRPKEGALITRLTNRYERALEWTTSHLWWTFGGIVTICIIGVTPLITEAVKFDMFPQESGRRLFMPYHVEGEYPVERVEEAVDKIEEYLFSRQEELNIRSIYSYFDQGRAESTILLTDEDDATLSTKEIIRRIEEGLPKIAIGLPSFEFEQQGGGEGFSIQVSGDSTETLNELSLDLARVLDSVEGLKDVTSDAEAGAREVRVIIDRTRAANVGLTTAQIGQMVAVAMRGENLREFRDPDGEIAMRIAFRENDRQSMEQLAALPLYTPDGERITLGTVASLRLGRSPDTIRRSDRQTAVIISANLEEDVSVEDVRPRVNSLMEQINLPPGYSWKEGQGFDRRDETAELMQQNIILGVACIFLVMAALFESLLLPFSIILGSIVFSIFGVFLFFAATDTTFSFMATIGIMILIGVVVNNGIVLVDHINNLRVSGMPRNEAIVVAGRDRLRPILMTVATTIVGLTPLAVGTTQVGGDGPPYYPMARAIIGGLAFSTVVSLLVVPALYVYFDNLAGWGRKVMRTARSVRRTSQPSEPPPPELTTT
ncbi:MAG: efflux RND transporter permease subunit [Gammaproteobacteria bacterium]|nr:efflux RND transporter permease subunit [Gammaproteobacteria bacterium]NNF49350.1 efflux RND transporter permease subunit [Woeseiaceae bacterium]MBT8093577.1 efflux RND transporter permease subunit [Gammaproteobacteria bacterium]MBT8106459.1 efflux RND transporter permease subunit [Gammaproteobacteria bacterium]NNK26474.1 efflux RND transporter permease subunit [Woeseiaceae bacterium]